MFMFAYMQDLIFYDDCLGFYVLIRDFATRLGVVITKTITKNENPNDN